MQKTKQSSKSAHTEDTTEVPTEVNAQSEQVVEDACCLIAEIDDILAEAAEKTPEPEPEWDPWGDQPREPKAHDDAYWLQKDDGDYLFLSEKFENAAADYEQKMEEWHEVRGLEYNVEGFGTGAAAASMLGGCVC